MQSHPVRRCLLAAALLATHAAAQAQWKPNKPITIIVPWAAGGSTDQVTRVTAAELEKAPEPEDRGAEPARRLRLGRHQERARGAEGRLHLDRRRAPRTWAPTRCSACSTPRAQDWNLYLNVAHIAVVGVNADAPYKTMNELLDAMKAKPGAVAVATAGVNSSGHSAIEAIARATGVTYKHVTYDGGNPAVVATVAGETQVTTQLAAEQTDMIRAKKIRPLAVVGDKPLEIEGYGTVPPLSQFIPGFKDPINYFGIFVPKGVPAEVTATLDKHLGRPRSSKSEALRKYAQGRGAMFAPMAGEEAQKAVFPAIQAYAWTQQAAGKAKVSPDTVGIPKP